MKAKIKTIAIILCVLLPAATANIVFAGDFYSSALEEGLALFQEEQFEEALERFEFAAFGLLEKTELMRRVHGYSALAMFQLSRFETARTELEKLAKNPKTLSHGDAGVDESDKDIFNVMLRTLFPEVKADVSTGTRRAFELVFINCLRAVDREEWDTVDLAIDKLSSLIPDDPRISMLRGESDFHSQRFNESCHELHSVQEYIQPEFHDRLLFTLVRACERVGMYGSLYKAYNAIKDRQTQLSLTPVIEAVAKRRQRDVAALAAKFDRSSMRKLANRFIGDNRLAFEIWSAAQGNTTLSKADMESLAFELARFDAATDREFYIQTAAWLESVNLPRQALKLMDKSGFAKNFSVENAEFLYQLGRLRGINGDIGRARNLMRRVLKLVPRHAAAQRFLDRLENNTKKQSQ